MNTRREFGSILIGATLSLTSSIRAIAQTPGYPDRIVRIIVPYTAGSTDLVARLLGAALGEFWKQTVIIQNMPGGGTIVGTNYVVRSPADGYTLLLSTSTISILPAIHQSLNFDIQTDLVPISRIADTPNILVVSNSVPAKSLQEFIAFAKKNPGTVTYSSAGAGTANHLAMALIGLKEGLELLHIPYRGAAPAVTAVVSGEVNSSYMPMETVLSMSKAGKLRALAISSSQRLDGAPEIPTFAEAGMKDFVPSNQWHALFAPKGTPPSVISTISASIKKVFENAEVRKHFTDVYMFPTPSSPSQSAEYLKSEVARWDGVVKDAKIPRQD